MKNKKTLGAQKELKAQVIEAGLCTNCGACVNLCPYAASYQDNLVLLDTCDREEGRCYAFCPRTPTRLDALRKSFFAPEDLTPELGSVKGFYLVRSADERVRKGAQHGGTVTTLLSTALRNGLIDTAVVAQSGANLLPQGGGRG
jgi:coenzyme F420 hydrogenase subunit beta